MDFIPLVCLNTDDFCAEANTFKKNPSSFVHVIYSNWLCHLMLSIYSRFIHTHGYYTNKMDFVHIPILVQGEGCEEIGKKNL